MEEVLKKPWVRKVEPFGSRVIGCATENSDYDYLVLATHRPSTSDLEGTGFVPDAKDPLYGVDFSSWKRGDVNLVFTDSEQYFQSTIEACVFCKKYKVYNKQDRCTLHKVFRDAVKYNTSVFRD